MAGLETKEVAEFSPGLFDGADFARSILARVRGTGSKRMAEHAAPCWHCRQQPGLCACAGCAVPIQLTGQPLAVWSYGECEACLGTGWLTWPAEIQKQQEER